jgi:hypothetical protein
MQPRTPGSDGRLLMDKGWELVSCRFASIIVCFSVVTTNITFFSIDAVES